MHIAVDVSPLKTGHALRGTGTYTTLLMEALQNYPSFHSFSFIENKEKLFNFDLVHYPYFDPFFLTLPIKKIIPTIVTIHDLIPIQYPKYFSPGFKGRMKWELQKFALRSVAQVITDSHASKKNIIKFAPFLNSKIEIVYLAPNSIFLPVTHLQTLSNIKKKYNLDENFLLYVGDVNWNKNIISLLKTFARFSNIQKYKDFKLCLVGKAFLENNTIETININKYIQKLELVNKVKLLGYVDNIELCSIYSLAKCYIQISYAEGFGLPVLEAMACGCPTVVSNNSSLTEIGGPSIQVDPNNIDSILLGILKTLNKYSVNDKRQVFINWSRSYSWKKVAKETIATYERVSEKYLSTK